MKLQIDLDEESDAGRYFIACARIRDIAPQSLLRRVVDVAMQDQLISSILDDAEVIKDRRKGEHRFFTPQKGGATA